MTDVACCSPSTTVYIIAHPSEKFSILLMSTESDMNTIINHAPNFAPKYLVRRIQPPEEPTPSSIFCQSPKVSELADIQCYLKAYFYQIYDARVDESEFNPHL